MSRRSYRQFCGVALALDLVGERWTLLIVRDLMLGPRRYSDLLASLEGITTNLLATRLKRLEEMSLIEKRTLPPPSSSRVYELTDTGRTLEPVVFSLGQFGAQYMSFPPKDLRTSLRWAMVSLMRRYSGNPGDEYCVVFELDDESFSLYAGPEELRIRDGTTPRPDAQLKASGRDFGRWMSGAKLSELRSSGKLQLSGRLSTVRRLARSVGLA